MTILVPYDGSGPAQDAVEYAVRHHPDEELVLLRVVEFASGSLEAGLELVKERLQAEREREPEALTEELTQLLDEEDIEFRIETVAGKPAREIVEFAEGEAVEEVVIGSHGREGVSRVLLGSVAETVVRRAPMTVTVVR